MKVANEVVNKVTLPCIPTRAMVAFPKIALNLEIGRDASKAACDAALGTDGLVILVCQRMAPIESPKKEDLYTVGVTARIKQLVKEEKGIYRALIEPIERAEITDFYHVGKHMVAEALEKSVTYYGDPIEEAALLKSIKASVADISMLFPKFSEDVYSNVSNANDLSLLCDFVSSNMVAEVESCQRLLETFDPAQRALALLTELEEEKQIMRAEAKINRKVHERMDKNQRDYFLREQIKAIKSELGEDEEFDDDDLAEYHEKIMRANLPEEMREKLIKELKKLSKMPFGSAEGGVTRNYIETCLEIPFGKETKDRIDIAHARKILDEDHDGLDDVKTRIIEYLAALKLNPGLKNQVLCLVGPPGTGKTSVASSIARAMNRKFVRISLGGVRDEADIRGHRKTYIGAMPGRIIEAILRSGSMNPLLVLDEVDKMGSDGRGDPASALLEVLDPEQNSTFHDNYLDLDYDLSKVLFIATANTLSTIPAPLLDRMELIEMSGYITEEKIEIAKRHLIPREKEEAGFRKDQKINFTKGALERLIEQYTRESGVRQLEKRINEIFRKEAFVYVKDGTIPYPTIKEEDLPLLLKKPPFTRDQYQGNDYAGVVTGLAWTSVGGEILYIETSVSRGKGSKLTLTGNLGDVMKESAVLALEYIKAHADTLGIDPGVFDNWNIHIHVPEGAVPKDGPSAGITIATSIASALTQRKVRKGIAMTGEITLRGKVLPVGGIKEKILAAKRAGITMIALSRENQKDIEEIPEIYLKGVTFKYVDDVQDVLKIALTDEKVDNPIDFTVAEEVKDEARP